MGYTLSLFNPSKFVHEEFKQEYQTSTHDPFTQADREKFLIGMMKVNFLKRLESSVKSFEITMERTIAKIEALEKKIRTFQALPNQNPKSAELELDLEDPGQDEELEEALLVGGKFTYHLRHLRLERWLKDLKKDKDQLRILYNAAKDVSPETDAKLQELKKLIAAKVAEPNHEQMRRVKQKGSRLHCLCRYRHLSLRIACAVGQQRPGHPRCARLRRRRHSHHLSAKRAFNHILTNFSPRSKWRDKIPHAAGG